MSEHADGEKDEAEGVDGRRDRSGTKYPYFGLEDAVRFAQTVQSIGGTDALEEAVQKELNVSSSTKSWIYRLSSAREFGLVERRGQKNEARLVLTDLGRKVLLPADEKEEIRALQAAFQAPVLYVKLMEHYAGSLLPQAHHLSNLLVREHRILASVSDNAASAFLESAQHARMVDARGVLTAGGVASPTQSEVPATPAPAATAPPRVDIVEVPEGCTRHVFQLRKGKQVVLPLPDDLTDRDVERLYRWLKTLPIEDPDEEGTAP